MSNLDTATKQFLQHCRYEKNLSEKTIYFYGVDLAQFKAFLAEHEYPAGIGEIDKQHFKHYLRELSKWKTKTIKRKIASLKAIFNYLEFEDLIIVNPIRRIRISLKEAAILPKALTKMEARSILEEAYKAVAGAPGNSWAYHERVRDAVVIELLFSSGARVSEIAGLQSGDLDFSSGSVILRGKGSKERYIQVCHPGALELLNSYRRLFEQKITAAGGSLLVNRLGRALSDQSIRNMVRQVSKKAGIVKNVTPHVFRHTFATLLLENDVDIKYIQSLLGHSSIATTQIYTQVNREKQQQLLRDKHPRMDFSMVLA